MASTKKYDLVAKIGEYELNGEKKARWFPCGAVFENEKGQLSAKINGIPVGTDWNGWLNLSIPNEQRSGSGSASASSASSNAKVSTAKVEAKKIEPISEEPSGDKDTDNLPF